MVFNFSCPYTCLCFIKQYKNHDSQTHQMESHMQNCMLALAAKFLFLNNVILWKFVCPTLVIFYDWVSRSTPMSEKQLFGGEKNVFFITKNKSFVWQSCRNMTGISKKQTSMTGQPQSDTTSVNVTHFNYIHKHCKLPHPKVITLSCSLFQHWIIKYLQIIQTYSYKKKLVAINWCVTIPK
jgi:hypothetical protein